MAAWDELLGSRRLTGKGRRAAQCIRSPECGASRRHQAWGAGWDGWKRADQEEVEVGLL